MSLLLLVFAIWLGVTVGLTGAWCFITWLYRHRSRQLNRVRPAGLPADPPEANPMRVIGGGSRGPNLTNVVDNNERSS